MFPDNNPSRRNLRNDFGVGQMSKEQLDDIADHGGVVGVIPTGDARCKHLPEQVHGYKPFWIETDGMRTKGKLILCAMNPETQLRLETGIARQLAEQVGEEFSVEHLRMVSAARGAKNGMVFRVLYTAWTTLRQDSWITFPAQGDVEECMEWVGTLDPHSLLRELRAELVFAVYEVRMRYRHFLQTGLVYLGEPNKAATAEIKRSMKAGRAA